MNDDYYHFDEKNYQAVGRKSKKKFRLGDKVMVRIVRVDTTANQIDFGLVEEERKQEKKRKSKRRQ